MAEGEKSGEAEESMKERRLEDAVDGSGDGVLGEKDIISEVCGITVSEVKA